MKDVLVVTVPRGGVKPDDFGRFREYVIESILRDVLTLADWTAIGKALDRLEAAVDGT